MSDTNEERGDSATEFTENFIGERNDAEAVFWYGTYSLIMSFGLIVVYHLIDGTDWIALYGGVDGFKYKWYGYVPIAMTWLAVSASFFVFIWLSSHNKAITRLQRRPLRTAAPALVRCSTTSA